MQIIKPKVEIINEQNTLKRIELAGRTCYKSEDRITSNSAEKFFNAIVKHGHNSVLEHSNLIVYAENDETVQHLIDMCEDFASRVKHPHHIRNSLYDDSVYVCEDDGYSYTMNHVLSGNLRAWRDIVATYPAESLFVNLFYTHPWFKDIYDNHNKECRAKQLKEFTYEDYLDSKCSNVGQAKILPWVPGKQHNIVTARITTSRGVTHEIVRHREMSFSQESTRYVNYKDVAIIEPWWYAVPSIENYERLRTVFLNGNLQAEKHYLEYINLGAKPQLARGVLSNDTKTEIVVTGNIAAWERFVELRESAAAHPDIQIVAKLFREVSGIYETDWKKGIV